MPKVAVVILSWNGKQMLQAYLPSVLESGYPEIEVVVADNQSTDGTAEMVGARFPSVRLIQLERNHGFAAGYNEALKQVNADYYVLLNQDVEVTSGWLEPLVELMESDPHIASCQPKIKDLSNRAKFEYAGASGGFMDSLAYTFCRGRVFETLEEDNGQYNDTIECAWASGAAFMVQSELYHKFGGLDESFTAHMEEIDFCWRVKNAGYKVMCCPRSEVFHVGGASLAQGHPRKTFLNFRNNFIMLIKDERGAKLLYKIPVRWTLDVIAAIRFLLTGQFKQWLAVFTSHLHIIFRFGNWWGKHVAVKKMVQENRVGARNRVGFVKGLIVWRYFVLGQKQYSEVK